MIKTKTITKKIETEVYEYMECDICKRRTHRYYWGDGDCHRIEPEIEYKEGDYYPEGSLGYTLSFDICPDCFKDKVIPAIEGMTDRKFRREDWDY